MKTSYKKKGRSLAAFFALFIVIGLDAALLPRSPGPVIRTAEKLGAETECVYCTARHRLMDWEQKFREVRDLLSMKVQPTHPNS